MTRRRGLPVLLAVLFVGVPLIEIYVLVQIGQVIGAVVDDPAADRCPA